MDETYRLSKDWCHLCRKDLSLSKANRRVLHMSLHTLFDPRAARTSNPCAFCLKSDPALCLLHLSDQMNRGKYQLDTTRSSCLMLVPFSFGNLSKSTPANPCTNHPVKCPHSSCARVLWRYNLKTHLQVDHSLSDERLSAHEELFEITEAELLRMGDKWKTVLKQKGKRFKSIQSAKRASQIKISTGHSSRAAFRYVFHLTNLFFKAHSDSQSNSNSARSD